MSLKEYVRKRHFEDTPEPPPSKEAPSGPQPMFCVQRHDATRLHYDFRLEIDGVLKSWAVPKGPSLDPTKKNLAMHVEDHPIEYGSFEGNIPAGNYGAGSVMLWDQGTFDLLGDMPAADQIKRGDLKFRLHGEKLKGEFAIVLMKGRGKGNEWLLIKKRDEHAEEGWDIEEFARSVVTGRTQQEIAEDLPPVKPQKKAAPKKAIKKSASKKASKKTASKTASKKSGDLTEPLRREKITMPKGAVEAPMPGFFTPMLATIANKPPAGSSWVYEIKWDGIRALSFIEDQQVRIFTRNGNRCDSQYPELLTLPHFVSADSAIVDAEIAVLDEKGRSRFSLIQPRLHISDPNSISHLARKTPVTFFAFDLLYLNGYDLRKCSLADRKKLLSGILETNEKIRYSEHFERPGDEMLEAARQLGLEGIVAKKKDSHYELKRSDCWLKLKVNQEQEFVIAGFTHGERELFSSLVLGVYEGRDLVHVGQVGTGFNDKSLKMLYQRMKPLITEKKPFSKGVKLPRKVTWLKPELVCNVKYLEFTPDGQLRAPVFLGLRDDKRPEEVHREQTEGKPGPPAIEDLPLTNRQKVWFPTDKITKGDVLDYYRDVADLIVPHLEGRPLSLKRYPNGIDEEYFFQKNAAESFPDWIPTETIPSEEREINYVICNDTQTLLYLTNLGCIDQNPWMSRVGTLDNPDFALIDLDPVECGYDKIVEAAQLVREELEKLKLIGYPKTTGGDGMHIYIPLEPVYTYDQVRSFAEILSHLVLARNRDLFTTPRSVAKRRKGTVYFDYLQIAKSKTISAPYVVRAHAGAPVATPLEWNEVKPGLRPAMFHLRNVRERFAKRGDLFAGVLKKRQRIETALARLKTGG
jgi:bifunctional non-homologous end joining protein LigD